MRGVRKDVRLWREEVVAAFRFPWDRGKHRFRVSVTVSVSTQGANHELYRHRPPQEDYQRMRGQPSCPKAPPSVWSALRVCTSARVFPLARWRKKALPRPALPIQHSQPENTAPTG